MAYYSAYFDDSGHPDDSVHVVCAGCVADVDQWIQFEREWLAQLAPLDTKIFHAVDFDQGKPPYDQLSELERINLLHLLIGIIIRRVEKTCVSIVPMDAYNDINKSFVFAETFAYPFPTAGRYCIGQVEQWAKKHSIDTNTIKYFFENGTKHSRQLEWIAERDGIPMPLFPGKRDSVPLQAADLIGWIITQILTRRFKQEHMDAAERIENHSLDLMQFTSVAGMTVVHYSNIARRDPNMRYKCKVVRMKGGQRVPIIQFWPKGARREPLINKKTLELPTRLPPLSMYEIPEEPSLISALSEFHEGRQALMEAANRDKIKK